MTLEIRLKSIRPAAECFIEQAAWQNSREAQNCRDKKILIFFFAFPFLSGKFGKQSLRSLAAITFFFGITVFLYQNQIPVLQGALETILCFPDLGHNE
jgi:hypothetical protein